MQIQTVRTTVDLEVDKARLLKQIAAEDRVSMKRVLDEAVEDLIAKKQLRRRRTAMQILEDLKAMAKWGKRSVNLTRAVIEEREKLAKASL